MNPTKLRIIHTKLAPPRLGADVIRRARLLERMQRASRHALTLISAPAGSGKSTLMAQWAAGETLPVAWLSLDPADSDPTVFVSYLVAAIQGVFPHSLPVVASLVHAAAPAPMDHLATELVNDLVELPGDFILALDDYQVVHSPAVHELLSLVLEFAPAQMHLVLASRVEPPLPLSRLRASGRLLELRMRDLRFTGEEIRTFMERATHQQLPAEVVDPLEQRTDGWGVGLRMAALALSDGGDVQDFVDRLQEAQQHVLVYLADEVLGKQPAGVQSFLLFTSILDRICTPLCEAVLDAAATRDGTSDGGDNSARTILEYVQRSNLFISPIDGQGTWFRYHTLFREFLAARLRDSVNAEIIRTMHARASHWFAAEGFVEEALHHALQADDYDAFDSILMGALTELLNTEDRQRLDRWLAMAPPEAQRGRIGFTLARCWQCHWRAQVSNIGALIAEQFPAWSLDAPIHGLPSDICGQVDLLQATVAYEQGQAEHAMRLSKRALETLPAAASFARGLTYVYLAGGMHLLGREDEFQALAKAEIQRVGEQFTVFSARLGIALMLMFTYEGRWQDALNWAKWLYERSRQQGFVLGTNWGHYGIAIASFECNHTEAALQHFTIVANSPYTAHLRAAVESLLYLAQIYQSQGEPGRADTCLDDAEQLIAHTGSERLERDVQAARARLALARGQVLYAYQVIGPMRDLTLPPEQMVNFLFPGLTIARVLLAYNTRDRVRQAQQLTERLLAAAQRIHYVGREVELLVLQAEIRHALDDEAGAFESLERALEIAEPHGATRPFVNAEGCIPDLLRRIPARGVAVRFTQHILQLIASSHLHARSAGAAQLVEPLTNRELDVLELVAKRWTNKEIAAALVISPMTVQRHLTNIFQKLAAENRRDAVDKANALGLLS